MVKSRKLEEKIDAILIYDAARNFQEIERMINERFPNRPTVLSRTKRHQVIKYASSLANGCEICSSAVSRLLKRNRYTSINKGPP